MIDVEMVDGTKEEELTVVEEKEEMDEDDDDDDEDTKAVEESLTGKVSKQKKKKHEKKPKKLRKEGIMVVLKREYDEKVKALSLLPEVMVTADTLVDDGFLVWAKYQGRIRLSFFVDRRSQYCFGF
jgi:hypothetical protein